MEGLFNEEEEKRSRGVLGEEIAPPVMVDRGPEMVAQSLAPQLGSSPKYLARGEYDMRLLSIIEERDIPFLIYAYIRGRKTRVWRDIYDFYLHLKVSVGGRGRRDIIRMEGVAKGGLPYEYAQPEKPGFFQRLLNRNWKEEYEREKL